MDPLSITASTITLIDAATSVYRFLASVRDADSNYSALCLELRDLTDFLRSIDQTYEACCRNPLSVVAVDEEVWRQGRIALRDCQQTLDELNSLVTRIKAPARSNTILRRARLGTQLRRHERTIVTFREKIRMSNRSLQTLLGVVNVSLSLQHNVSQEKALQELQKLNRYLEESQRAASDPSATSFLGDTDRHLVDNLQELIHAAESFHSVASDAASSICSEKAPGEPVWPADNYPSSVAPARMSSIKMRRIEMLLEGNQESTRSSSPAPLSSPASLQEVELDRPFEVHQDHAEPAHEKPSAKTFEADFDNLFSRGLSKMAQKAIRKADFAEAQEIVQQALKHHQSTRIMDLQHRRLRIQLAACKFFRGDGTKAEDLINRMAESATEFSPALISQLLYALALAQAHELDFTSTKRTCQRIWQALQTCHFSVKAPGENDLWRLLAVSFRESGSKLHAEAIEEELPELKLDAQLPTATSVLLNSEEFLTELFDVQSTVDIPWTLVDQLQHNEACLEFSALQRRQMQNPECDRDIIIYEPKVKTLVKSASEPEMHGALNISSTSYRGHHQSLQRRLDPKNTTRLRKAPPSISSSHNETTAPFNRLRNTVRRLSGRRRRYPTSSSDSISQEGARPSPTSVFAKFRARFLISNPELGTNDLMEDNGGRIVQWLRGQDIVDRQSTTTLSDDASYTGRTHMGTAGSIRRRFSFEDTAKTPTIEEASSFRSIQENPIYELPGSGTHWELDVSVSDQQLYRNPSIINGGREDQFQTRRVEQPSPSDQPPSNQNKMYKQGNNDSGYYSDPERKNGSGASGNNPMPEGKADDESDNDKVKPSRWKTARTWLLNRSLRRAKHRKPSSNLLARKSSIVKLPAHGYEYHGPEAVPGPYTLEEDSSEEEFNSIHRGIPEQLQVVEHPEVLLDNNSHSTTSHIEPENSDCRRNVVEDSGTTCDPGLPCELEAHFPDPLQRLGGTKFTPTVHSDSPVAKLKDDMSMRLANSASTEEFRRRIQGIFQDTSSLLLDNEGVAEDETGPQAQSQLYRQPYCQDEQDEVTS